MTETRDDRIRARAYDLWQSDGGKAGDDWAYWLQAEREVSEEETVSVNSAPAEDAPAAIPAEDPIKKASAKKTPAPKAAASKPAGSKAAATKPPAKSKAKAASAEPAPEKR